jgi:DNA-binding transcriptional regulator LsrR (DeoR family)
MTTYDRLELLATIADLYYVRRLGQAEIAQRLGYSRSAISRLLSEAHDKQIVEIRVNHPLQRDVDLEMALRETFGLREAFVARRGSLGYEQMLTLLGRLGAAYLDEVWDEPCVVGLSWGTAVYEVAAALRPRRLPGSEVVQLIGGIGRGDPQIDGPGVAMRVAQTVGGRYHTLNAPHVAADGAMRQALLAMPAIQDTLQLGLESSLAVVGIGSVVPERSSLLRAGYLSPTELAAIRATGAVGDVCGTHFDAHGRILDIEINRRVIGVSLRDLLETPCRVIGVAGGQVKAEAILGALRGRLVNVLVTDSSAAEYILSETLG